MKRFLSIFLTTLLMMTYIPTTYAKDAIKFQDVPDTWYTSALYDMVAEGYFTGKSNDTFDPSGNLTVAELATLLCRVNDKNENLSIDKGPWWYGYAKKSVKLGLLKQEQIDDSKFMTSTVTRELLADMCGKFIADREIITSDFNDQLKSKLSDFNEVSEDIRPFLLMCLSSGLLSGYPDGTYQPDKKLLRREAVFVIRNLVHRDQRKKVQLEGDSFIYEGFEFSKDKIVAKGFNGTDGISYEIGMKIVKSFLSQAHMTYDKTTGDCEVTMYLPPSIEGAQSISCSWLITSNNQRVFPTNKETLKIMKSLENGKLNIINVNIGPNLENINFIADFVWNPYPFGSNIEPVAAHITNEPSKSKPIRKGSINIADTHTGDISDFNELKHLNFLTIIN